MRTTTVIATSLGIRADTAERRRPPHLLVRRLPVSLAPSLVGRLHPANVRRRAGGAVVTCSVSEEQMVPEPPPPPKGSCYGCGQRLQFQFPDSAGHVLKERYDLKAKHKQLNLLLCQRCVALTHGRMVPGVKEWSQNRQSSDEELPKMLLTPEELREKLKVVRTEPALVVMLVDLLDASGSFLGRVRELIGNNPVMLVGTKADLLPKGTELLDVEEWLLETAAYKRLNVMGVKAISSRTSEGIPQAVSAIRRERRGRNVYVIGAANVGKSAFVRALLKEMGSMSSMQFDPAAITLAKRSPTESPMPGTTLSLIPLSCFATGQFLYDTPGLHLDHRLPHILTPSELKEIHPRKKLRPYLAPPVEEFSDEEQPGATYLWGGIARIDVVRAPVGTQLAFYGPAPLKAFGLQLLGEDDEIDFDDGEEEEKAIEIESELGEDAEEQKLYGAESVRQRGGLWLSRRAEIKTTGRKEALVDIAVSGLGGWVSVLGTSRKDMDIELRIYTPRGVEAFVRPPLPVPDPVQLQRARQ